LSVVEIVFVVVTDSDDDPLTQIHPVDFLTPVVYFVTYVTSFSMTVLSVKSGIRTSPSQFFLYLFSVICGALTFRSYLFRLWQSAK
jgi:hypothetical protein